MFLALIIQAFLSSCVLPTVFCDQAINSGGKFPNLTSNGTLAFTDLIYSPFTSALPSPKLQLIQHEYPHLLISPNNSITKYSLLQKNQLNYEDPTKIFSDRSGPARMPKVRSNSKDYGESSHYRMKGGRQSSKKGYYMNLLQKLLRSPRNSKRDYSTSSLSSKNGFDSKYGKISSVAMSAPGWGWGWGKAGGGGKHGYSLLEVLLCGLSLLSLGGFLLNLLLNLMNLFGFGMMTSTSTYPVTVTSTQTATATGTGGGGVTTTGGITVASAGSGLGFTGRTIDSMAGNGWGWKDSSSRFNLHIKLPKNKGSSTTSAPTLSLTGDLPSVSATGGFGFGGRKRRKREVFKPYVDPATALDIFAKAVLNSINSAMNKYECMEMILCENNKRARVIGQWLEYFMPVYSFSVSYFGHRSGAHDSLLDHIRAIVLGATETNCQAHFPRCKEEGRGDGLG